MSRPFPFGNQLEIRDGKASDRRCHAGELPRFVARADWNILELQAPTAASFHCLPVVLGHKDPFDRLLIWTAIRKKLVFVSKDRALPEYKKLGLEISN